MNTKNFSVFITSMTALVFIYTLSTIILRDKKNVNRHEDDTSSQSLRFLHSYFPITTKGLVHRHMYRPISSNSVANITYTTFIHEFVPFYIVSVLNVDPVRHVTMIQDTFRHYLNDTQTHLNPCSITTRELYLMYNTIVLYCFQISLLQKQHYRLVFESLTFIRTLPEHDYLNDSIYTVYASTLYLYTYVTTLSHDIRSLTSLFHKKLNVSSISITPCTILKKKTLSLVERIRTNTLEQDVLNFTNGLRTSIQTLSELPDRTSHTQNIVYMTYVSIMMNMVYQTTQYLNYMITYVHDTFDDDLERFLTSETTVFIYSVLQSFNKWYNSFNLPSLNSCALNNNTFIELFNTIDIKNMQQQQLSDLQNNITTPFNQLSARLPTLNSQLNSYLDALTANTDASVNSGIRMLKQKYTDSYQQGNALVGSIKQYLSTAVLFLDNATFSSIPIMKQWNDLHTTLTNLKNTNPNDPKINDITNQLMSMNDSVQVLVNTQQNLIKNYPTDGANMKAMIVSLARIIDNMVPLNVTLELPVHALTPLLLKSLISQIISGLTPSALMHIKNSNDKSGTISYVMYKVLLLQPDVYSSHSVSFVAQSLSTWFSTKPVQYFNDLVSHDESFSLTNYISGFGKSVGLETQHFGESRGVGSPKPHFGESRGVGSPKPHFGNEGFGVSKGLMQYGSHSERFNDRNFNCPPQNIIDEINTNCNTKKKVNESFGNTQHGHYFDLGTIMSSFEKEPLKPGANLPPELSWRYPELGRQSGKASYDIRGMPDVTVTSAPVIGLPTKPIV